MKTRAEITIETHRLLVVRQQGRAIRGWCEGCLAEVELITANEAAERAGVGSRTIYRWIENGGIHFTEDLGLLLVCAVSLPAPDVPSATVLKP
jgi:excisionase family DNA binding protein